MNTVVFRAARRGDVPAIVAQLADDIRGKGRENSALPLDQRYYDAFAAVAASPANYQVVGEREGVVVACAQLTVTPGMSHLGQVRGTIEGVRVAANCRGQRIGEALLAHLVDKARQSGCGIVQLTTNKARSDAQRFYARIGFENSHEGFKMELKT